MNDFYQFKINKIITNNESIIEPKKINIIVGPNSSGKSQFLKDIKYLCSNDSFTKKNIIVKDIDYDFPQDVESFIMSYNLRDRISKDEYNNIHIKNYYGANFNQYNPTNAFNSYFDCYNSNFSQDWEDGLTHDFEEIKRRGKEYAGEFLKKYGQLFFQYLGTEEKLFLCRKQKNHGEESNQLNALSEIKHHIEDFEIIRKFIQDIFNKDIFYDIFSYGDNLALRISNEISFDDFDYKKTEELNKLLKVPLIDDEGDGLKNFVSTFLAIKSMYKSVFLLDEPEAFLHPPLARKFGEIIAKEISKKQQVFIATHSEDIISGIFSVCDPNEIKIIRIERNNSINNIFQIDEDDCKNLKNKPILFMSNILNGLFSEKVYITESFSDSAIYQKLMIKYNSNSNFYFVNTEGKDKIGEILKFYKSLGVNTTAIYDFDYFRNEETIKDSLYFQMDDNKYKEIYEIFKKCREYLNDKAKKEYENSKDSTRKEKSYKDEYYHKQGINSFNDNKELKDLLIKTIDSLKEYDIYVLKTGCLESMLENNLSFSNNKKSWIDEALLKIEELDKEDINKLDIIDIFNGI